MVYQEMAQVKGWLPPLLTTFVALAVAGVAALYLFIHYIIDIVFDVVTLLLKVFFAYS